MTNLIGQRLGQYQLISKIGEGGMARVYRATQLNISREVAIKVLKETDSDPDFIERLEREARTIAKLSHPFIVKLFDYGHQDGMTYLVMELITGGSLAQQMSRGPLPLGTIAPVMSQLGAALDHAHRHGIVHRDLKPQNILLDNDGNALLTDFGLARMSQPSVVITQSGGVMGTPAYMAPEQWEGSTFDARTDIYSLGAILFEMVSGMLPFEGDSIYQLMHKHIYEAPPRLHDQIEQVPPGVDKVVLKALSKDPADRYSSAGEMAVAFSEAIESVDGRLPSVTTRPRPGLVPITRNLSDEGTLLPSEPK